MKLFHTFGRISATFDDPNLVSTAGLVPIAALADAAGLRKLVDERLSVPTDKGANAGLKVASLVAGMVAGADSIDDMALLRHGGMGRVFTRAYAPSTLGSFLRAFTFGHVRQLDAVASRFLIALAGLTPLLDTTIGSEAADTGDIHGGYALLDVDDTIIEVHGHAKQGAGFGYSGVRGLNALLATVTTATCAPVIVAQRLRKGACGSPRGAKRLVTDAVKTSRRLLGESRPMLVRADSALCRYRHKAESARTRIIPVPPHALVVAIAPVTILAAPRAELTDPLRSLVAAITGAASGVLMVATSAFNPFTPE